MLNYIRAEWYKVVHRRYFWVSLCLLLGLEGLFVLTLAMESLGGLQFSELVAILCVTMMAGVYLSILCVDLVDSDQSKGATLKNEVSFGIPRSRIYLGRLAAALLVALLMCLLVFTSYLGVAWLLSGHADLESEQINLMVLAFEVGASFPLWLGTLALSHCVFMLTRSPTASGIIMLLFLTWGGGIFWVLGQFKPFGLIGRFFGYVSTLVPTTPFGNLVGALTWPLMAQNWAIGLGWLVLSTGVGLFFFRRQDL